jgi:glycine/serine hydroxymethyltransferase
MGEDDMKRIAGWIVATLRAPEDEPALARTRAETIDFCRRFPVPGIA